MTEEENKPREFQCQQVSLAGHSSCVNALAVTADGRNIVSGSGDGTIRVWGIE